VRFVFGKYVFALVYSYDLSRVQLHVSSIDKISTCGIEVRGVTSVDDELFVLVPRDDNQVTVYSIGTTSCCVSSI